MPPPKSSVAALPSSTVVVIGILGFGLTWTRWHFFFLCPCTRTTLHLSLVFAPACAAAVAGTSRAMARTAMRARDMGSSGGQRRSRAPRAYPGAPGPGSRSALGFGLALEAVGRAAEQ